MSFLYVGDFQISSNDVYSVLCDGLKLDVVRTVRPFQRNRSRCHVLFRLDAAGESESFVFDASNRSVSGIEFLFCSVRFDALR